MSGGHIQGDRKPEPKLSAEDIIQKAKKKVGSVSPTAQQAAAESREISNFGAPSPENERPVDDSGERDHTAIAPGRKSPFER